MVTMVAISLALELEAPCRGIGAFLLLVPTYVRTAVIVRRVRASGSSIQHWRHYIAFYLRSFVLFLFTYLATGVAFYAAFAPFAAYIGMTERGAIDFDPERLLVNLVLFLSGLFCGLASGGTVLVLIGLRYWPICQAVDRYLVQHGFGQSRGDALVRGSV